MDTIKIVGNPLYQWELGRKVQLFPLPNMTVDEVHFSNHGDSEALVVKPKNENGMIIAEIPNVLLQSGNHLVVYSVNVAEGFIDTLRSCTFAVRKRAKPSDYVYTETEVLNYATLDKRLRKVETGGGAINGIPAGGKAGQYLCKQSDEDYDVAWSDLVIPEQYGLVSYDQDKTITIT